MKISQIAPLLMVGLLAGAIQGVYAKDLDLTTAGASGTINGATFTQVNALPTGSGVIDSFVRISQSNMAQVSGYNTTVNNVFQNTSDDTHNHEITVGQVGFITSGSNTVMRFLLDINQLNSIDNKTGHNNALLNLDDVQIFVSTVPNQAKPSPAFDGNGVLGLGSSALAYRMDASPDGPGTVTLNYGLNTGSGSGDMTLDIAQDAISNALSTLYNTAFANLSLAQKNGAYIYLYSAFGSDPNNNNDGYEEWAHFSGKPYGQDACVPAPDNNFCRPEEIPEPGALALVGLALGIAGGISRRRAKA